MKDTFLNPNFRYKYTFNEIENDIFEINNAFDIYFLQKDINKIYLSGSDEFKRENLDIYEFKNEKFKKKLSLNKHKEFVSCCKYFLNKKSKQEYLVSIDVGSQSSNTIIWKILDENNYQDFLIINNKDNIRYPFTLIFNNQTKDKLYFIHTCSYVESEIYMENKKIFKKINFTEGKILYYDIWENNIKNKNYIIQCNKNYIYIYDIFEKQISFIKIKNNKLEGNNYSCNIIYNKNNTDILCIINEKGNIVFYDLFKNLITSIIKINDNNLVNSCQFNEKYLIVLSKTGFFVTLDIDNKNIINKICSNELNNIKTIKIFNHYIYGKYILLGGFMKGIKIYKNYSNILIPRK